MKHKLGKQGRVLSDSEKLEAIMNIVDKIDKEYLTVAEYKIQKIIHNFHGEIPEHITRNTNLILEGE